MEKVILLIGAGPMAVEYSKVLTALNVEQVVVGRGKSSAESFKKQTGIDVVCENQTIIPTRFNVSDFHAAIVATSEDTIGAVSRKLVAMGINRILTEKPGGLTIQDIEKLNDCTIKHSSNVFIAYNRRYYASVNKIQEIIQDDGGVTSFNFEFTEWGHVIASLEKHSGIKEEWLLANSTHVIDLAFFLGGRPKEIASFHSGTTFWHPKGTIFSGAGISEKGALFSYCANWESPGRWAIEVLTKKHRLILKPLEKLQMQNIGELSSTFVDLDDEIDTLFKAGLFRQVEAFISCDDKNLLRVEEQCQMLEIYQKMRGW